MPDFQGFFHGKRRLLLIAAVLILCAAGGVFVGIPWWKDSVLVRELTAMQGQEYGDRAQRILELRDSISQDPGNAELLISLGNNWKQIADFTQKPEHFSHALEAYQRAYQVSGEKSSLPLANQGTIYVLQRDFANAERVFRLAIEKNPGEPEYYVRLVEALRFAQAPHETVIDVYRMGLEQLVDNALMVQSLAEYLFDIGRYTDALTYYRLLANRFEGFDERIAQIEALIAAGGAPAAP